MPGAVSTKTIKDAAGSNVTMRVWDESGAGTGPFSFMTVLAADAVKLAKAEDAAHSSGDEGLQVLAVRRDTLSAAGADGDYVTFNIDANGRLYVQANGDIAHDAADAGAPVKTGAVAIAHGTNPTAVAAADRTNLYANRAGIPFFIGGHPNVITRGHLVADSDGAQTDAALLTVGAGTKIVVTRITIVCDNANTGDCRVAIGFGTANVPTNSLSGVAGLLVDGSFDGGAGVTIGDGSGILGIGADGEDLRLTCSDPAGGNIRITYSYYTIES